MSGSSYQTDLSAWWDSGSSNRVTSLTEVQLFIQFIWSEAQQKWDKTEEKNEKGCSKSWIAVNTDTVICLSFVNTAVEFCETPLSVLSSKIEKRFFAFEYNLCTSGWFIHTNIKATLQRAPNGYLQIPSQLCCRSCCNSFYGQMENIMPCFFQPQCHEGFSFKRLNLDHTMSPQIVLLVLFSQKNHLTGIYPCVC